MEFLSDFRTPDLRALLNSYKGAIAAVKFVLQANLLAQFSLIAASEQAHRQLSAAITETDFDNTGSNENEKENEDERESDNS
jgi:hypothetical protein